MNLALQFLVKAMSITNIKTQTTVIIIKPRMTEFNQEIFGATTCV